MWSLDLGALQDNCRPLFASWSLLSRAEEADGQVAQATRAEITSLVNAALDAWPTDVLAAPGIYLF